MTFGEFVAFYGLARSEGLVLRYLSDAYRALRQTVPDSAKTEELTDLIEWLGELVRQADSSLLDEWEQLTDPDAGDGGAGPAGRPPSQPRPITGNARAFRVLVRNAMFRRVELAARRRWIDLGELDAEAGGLDADAWQDAIEDVLRRARRPRHRPGRPRPAMLHDRASSPAGGSSGRSSTTPPATTTGASPPRSTSRRRTRRARRSCAPPASSRCDPQAALAVTSSSSASA